MRVEQDRVARPLAVEGEAGAVMADLDDAGRPSTQPRADASAAGAGGRAGPERGPKRILGEGGRMSISISS